MWETVRLGDVVSYIKNNAQSGHLPYVGLENIASETMSLAGEITVRENTSTTFSFDESHVLYGRLRPYLKKVFLPDFKGQCSTEIFCLQPKSNVLRGFLAYWLIEPSTAAKIESTSTGARMPRANMNALLNFEFPLPPLAEQKRIVERLDKAFAEIDKAIATAEAKEGEIERLVQQSINITINRPCSRVLEKTLEQIADFLDYRGRTPEKSDDGIKLLTAKNVRMGFIKNSPEEFVSEKVYRLHMTRGFPKIGDVVFTTEAPLGLIAQIEDESVALGQRLIVFQPRGECIKSDFLKYSLMSTSNQEKIQSAGTGATVKGIKASLLKKIVISFPESVEEQTSRVTKVKKIEEATNSLREATHRKIYDLTALKASILKEELTPSEAV